MDKNSIYKAVFEEINDSLEWGSDCKDHNYSWYIDGVVSLANRMLEKFDEPAEEDAAK